MADEAGRTSVRAVRAVRERRGFSILGASVIVALVAMLLPGGSASASSGPPAVLIPSQGAYLGAYVGQRGTETKQQAIRRVETQIGRQFAIDHEYYKWDSPFPTAQESWAAGRGMLPFLNWKAQRRDGSAVPWNTVASGAQDAAIAARADAIKAFGSPIYLAFHHEPEDDLATWGTPAAYVAAFRHIVSIFRSRGVTNVAFVWDMMSWTFDPRSGRDPNAYYPGDSYVDIIGVDGYNWYPGRAGAPWESFQQVFKPSNDFAVAHGKPWMAVEAGSEEDPLRPGSKGQWFRDVVGTAKGWPSMKAFIYFDTIKEFAPNSWNSDTSASSMQGFAALGLDPYFHPGSPAPSHSPSPTPAPSPSPAPSKSPTPSSPPPSSSTSSTSSAPSSLPPSPSSSPSSSPPPSPPPSSGPPSGPWPLTDPLDEGIPSRTVRTLDHGGVSTFDSVVIQGKASLAYDDAHSRGGVGLSAKHQTGAGGSAYYAWDRSFGTHRAWFGRVYVWFDALPRGGVQLVRARRSSAFQMAIDVLPTGRLAVEDRFHQRVAVTALSIRTGSWVRIEWRVDQTTGRVEVRLFDRPNDTTATDKAITPPRQHIGRSTDEVDIGRAGGGSFPSVFWTDEPGLRRFGFLGPA